MSRLRRKNASNEPESSCPASPSIARKFVNAKAETLFHEQLATRAFVPKMGFREPQPLYRETIKGLAWQRICAHPRPRIAPLVKEFHANLPSHNNSACYVRWKWVEFSPTTINRFYALPQGHSKEFEEFYTAPDLEVMIQRLTNGGARWRRNPRGECLDFPQGALTEEARVWFYFMSSCISPSQHLSTVYRDWAILLYAIVERLRFDVGHFMHRSLLKAARSRSIGGISHPYLITAMCLRAGVHTFD